MSNTLHSKDTRDSKKRKYYTSKLFFKYVPTKLDLRFCLEGLKGWWTAYGTACPNTDCAA